MMRSISTYALVAAIVCTAVSAIAQEPGWIGVSLEERNEGGAVVRTIEPNSPAARAGLREGDVILQYNKEQVIGVQHLTRLVRETPVGRAVELKIRRDNRDETVQVTPDAARQPGRLGRFELDVPGFHILTDRISRDFPTIQVNGSYVQAGVRVEQLTDQLRDFFGVYSDSGVLVSSINQGSAAERAGLKAGDVITSIDGMNVRTPAEFSLGMRSGGTRSTLKVFRDKQEREITLDRGAR